MAITFQLGISLPSKRPMPGNNFVMLEIQGKEVLSCCRLKPKTISYLSFWWSFGHNLHLLLSLFYRSVALNFYSKINWQNPFKIEINTIKEDMERRKRDERWVQRCDPINSRSSFLLLLILFVLSSFLALTWKGFLTLKNYYFINLGMKVKGKSPVHLAVTSYVLSGCYLHVSSD